VIRHIRKIIPKATDHPTPKPVALSAHFIALHSQPGDLVLDPFLGGGSTLVAATWDAAPSASTLTSAGARWRRDAWTAKFKGAMAA